MRPEHSETKAKTETETETCPVKSIAGESNTNRYVLFLYYTHEVNDEPKMDFAFKIINKKDVQQ